MIVCEKTARKLIPVASGKGGVGKSLVTANLGLLLARSGRKTILVDLDLGGSNLHSYLGLKNKHPGIGNFLSGRSQSFSSILSKTDFPNLWFVPGDVLVPGIANLSFGQKKTLLDNIAKLDADYVLLDLGSGSHYNTIDFFLMSNSGLLVTSPHVTSVLNCYNFMKSLVFRFIQRAFVPNAKVSGYLKKLVKEKLPGTLPEFDRILADIDELSAAAGRKVRSYLSLLKPSIIVNMADSPDDISLAEGLRSLMRKNLNVESSCLGLIYMDKRVDDSIKNLEPLVEADSACLPSRQLARIAEKILQSADFPLMPLDLSQYKDSFELASIEAQIDYEEIAAPAAADGTDQGSQEFLAVISAQHSRIQELQNTVRMLSLKNQPQ